jgi:hypothetical protein
MHYATYIQTKCQKKKKDPRFSRKNENRRRKKNFSETARERAMASYPLVNASAFTGVEK